MTRQRRLARLRHTAAVLVMVAVLAACGTPAPDAAETPGSPMAVTTARVAPAMVPDSFEVGALVTASSSATIASRVLAPVTAVRVRAGDRVRAGEVLVTLEAAGEAARLQQAESAVAAARQGAAAAASDETTAAAEQTLAEAWHTRIAALHQRQSATAQELDEAVSRRAASAARADGARARVEQAHAQLAAALAAADAARATHAYATITAPFDGLVTERLVDPGSIAAPGAPLLRLDADGAARVEARVDAARTRFVQVGDSASVVLDDSAGPAPIDARVVEVARAIEAGSHAFTVKLELPPDLSPRSGSFARVRFRGPLREVTAVPASAVRRNGQLASVFVVSGGVARLRLVQVGGESPAGIEIVAGLDPGEVVVTDPPEGLIDGQAVEGAGQ